MNALVKTVIGDSVGQLLCCVSPQTDGKTSAIGKPKKLSQKAYQEHLQQLEEEKKKRDKVFAQRKAERAVVRNRLREKYQLRQNENDKQQLRAATGRVVVPSELAAVAQAEKVPENGPSLLEEIPMLQDINLTELKTTVQATASELYQTTQKQCALM